MGQFAFTRTLHRLRPHLSTHRNENEPVQAFVYIPPNFSLAICFDGSSLKHEVFNNEMFYYSHLDIFGGLFYDYHSPW